MDRLVYKRGFTKIIITLIIAVVAVFILYNATKNPFVFLVLFAFVIFSLAAMRNRLVVEHGKLYFERLLFSKEISLKDVSQISLERLDTMSTEKSSETFVAVYGNNSQFVFRFPFAYLAGRDKQQFIDTLHASNPTIQINLEFQNYNLNALIKEYKDYKNSKKEEEQ